ncbi:Protein RALF-like 4 [Vitis vinifera]|uniref:Protein RALF-like 4 n=1 Tax=Vitis vinifera TaxID=29760 RepID=A0A438CFB7_VITVI|nr:Protein RALF-like 4 [Vitis vinifera]RVW79306.1 Protein RALF-like 4 [Vitis vinifera]
MAPRVGLLLLFLLLLASAMMESAAALFSEANWGLTHFAGADLGGRRACNGLVGDCIDPYAETMMDSEVSRRTLAQGGKFISYGALKKNNVPCNRRGRSYYNCRKGGRANPYQRGCSTITHCARYTN